VIVHVFRAYNLALKFFFAILKLWLGKLLGIYSGASSVTDDIH